MMSRAAPLILVVEDNSAVLESLRFMLEVEGFEVCAFDNVAGLLEADWLSEVACLVVDYHMPIMNGIDLLGHLRKLQILAPAILVTGHPVAMVHDRAIAAGFAGIVDKPLRDKVLVEEIRQALATTERRQASAIPPT